MIVAKLNPVGVDTVINRLQTHLDKKLPGFLNWENNHRAYKNPRKPNETGFIAEVYTSNGEYRECFFNDRYSATSFFITEDEVTFEETIAQQECSWILQIRLTDIYTTIHRADEECKNDVIEALKSFKDIEFISLETGIDNVYREFDTTNLKYDDMSDLFVLRVNFSTTFESTCCTNC